MLTEFLKLLTKKDINKLNDSYPTCNETVVFGWKDDKREISLEIGFETMSFYVKLKKVKRLDFNNLKINRKNLQMLSKYINMN